VWVYLETAERVPSLFVVNGVKVGQVSIEGGFLMGFFRAGTVGSAEKKHLI